MAAEVGCVTPNVVWRWMGRLAARQARVELTPVSCHRHCSDLDGLVVFTNDHAQVLTDPA
jgi:hypothetical protein